MKYSLKFNDFDELQQTGWAISQLGVYYYLNQKEQEFLHELLRKFDTIWDNQLYPKHTRQTLVGDTSIVLDENQVSFMSEWLQIFSNKYSKIAALKDRLIPIETDKPMLQAAA